MAVGESHLRLVERGAPAVVPEREWALFTFQEPLERLLAAGVIGLRPAGGYRIVEPRQYVGHLRMPGRSITIDPKSPVLMRLLRELGSELQGKVVEGQTLPSRDEVPGEADPASAFVSALDDLVGNGPPFEYRRVTSITTRPRGKILMGPTIRDLASKGIRHAVWSTVSRRTYDADLADLVATTTSHVQDEYDLAPRDAVQLERLAGVVGADATVATLPRASELMSQLAERHTDRPDVGRLIEVCRAILARETTVWDLEIALPGGECRFADMDRLWEVALTVAFRRALGPTLRCELHPIQGAGISITEHGTEIDPDVLVIGEGRYVAVIDAKYSEVDRPSASDVYQVMCYARKLRCGGAVLAYLSPGATWERYLGMGDGVKIAAFGLSVGSDVRDLVTVAKRAFDAVAPNES